MNNTRTILRSNARVQEKHDDAFDRVFAIRREAERILRLRQLRTQVRITVVNQKHDLPF
jgi:hypothetical protein